MCNRFLNFSSFPSAKRHFSAWLLPILFILAAWPGQAEESLGPSRPGTPPSQSPADEERKALQKKALAEAQKAVAADPQSSAARLALAVAYGRVAKDEAPKRQIELSKLIKEEAEEAVRLDPRNDVAWHVLARWNFEMASVNPFLRGLAQVIYGKFPDASTARAEECFRKAIAAGPPRVMHHVEYGLMLVELNRKNDARKQLEIGLSLPAKDQEDEETQQRASQALDRLR
jgi:predicted Zn-dependent protease